MRENAGDQVTYVPPVGRKVQRFAGPDDAVVQMLPLRSLHASASPVVFGNTCARVKAGLQGVSMEERVHVSRLTMGGEPAARTVSLGSTSRSQALELASGSNGGR